VFELFHERYLADGGAGCSLLRIEVDLLERDEFAGLSVAPFEDLFRIASGFCCLEPGRLVVAVAFAALTVAYVPSPSFSNCWNDERWRLPSIVAAVDDARSIMKWGLGSG
jgi:hypothetical protein